VRILLYTQWCSPEPAFKSVPFARALLNRGHDVRILTGYPNYPGGRIYSGYAIRPWFKEIIDEIPILRTPLYPSHDNSNIRRTLNYVSFGFSSTLPLLCGWKPDVIYVYNLVTLGALGRINRWLKSIPFVLDVQDLWPDSVFQSGMGNKLIAAPLRALCNFAYRGADRVVVQSPGFREELVRRGLDFDKIEVVYNWADEAGLSDPNQLTDVPEDELNRLKGRFNIVYAGNLGAAQALENVVQAAAITAETNPRIQWVFVGRGVRRDALEELARRVAPQNTLFLPPRPLGAMVSLSARSEALLVHLRDARLFSLTIPSKLQGALAMGRPILAAVSGDAAQLVKISGAGVACPPGQPARLAEAAANIAAISVKELNAMGEAGRKFYRSQLSLEQGVSRFETIFEDVVHRRRLSSQS